jgi:hypothetical protein
MRKRKNRHLSIFLFAKKLNLLTFNINKIYFPSIILIYFFDNIQI